MNKIFTSWCGFTLNGAAQVDLLVPHHCNHALWAAGEGGRPHLLVSLLSLCPTAGLGSAKADSAHGV